MKPPDPLAVAELEAIERKLVLGLSVGFVPERTVTEDDLTDVPSRVFFRAVQMLQRQGADTSQPIVMREQMVRDGHAEYWSLIEMEAPVLIGEFRSAVHRVLQESLVRRASRHLKVALSKVEQEGRSLSPELLEETVTGLVARAFIGGGRDIPTTDDEALAALRDLLDVGMDREGVVCSANTDQDELTGGAAPGQLVILAARPGVGKSAFMLQWVTSVIRTHGPAMLVSLEMTSQEIAFRMAQQIRKVRKDDLTPADVENARLLQRRGPLYIFDSGHGVDRLAARIANLKMRHPDLAAVFVDYLGLLRMPGRHGKTYDEVSAIVRRLKELAQEYKLPIIALNQLNRAVQGRQDKRPALSDLRDSGVIEEAANQVYFLYREGYDARDAGPGPAELIVAKNRSGRVGTVPLWWEPEFVSFYPLERVQQDPQPSSIASRNGRTSDHETEQAWHQEIL